MKDGTTLALPEYVYTGSVAASTNTTASDSFQVRVVPIDPQYLDFKNAVSASGPCNIC